MNQKDITRKIMAFAKERKLDKTPIQPVLYGLDRSGRTFEGMTPRQIQSIVDKMAEDAKKIYEQQEGLKHDPRAKTIYFTDGEGSSNYRGVPRMNTYKDRAFEHAVIQQYKLPNSKMIIAPSNPKEKELIGELEDRMHKAYLERKIELEWIRRMARRLI